jgi:2-iminobutanoate/2-iminopropanoate deaminase
MPLRETIHCADVPTANPSYSQAVKVAGVVYAAGQIGVDPKTGRLVNDNMADQTRQALDNLSAILRAAGSSMKLVAKTTVYIVDMGRWGQMNEVYMSFFPHDPPAKTTVEVSGLALGALVEIEAIAAA